jgi:membrane protein DedA with SNARE-associated domain
MSDPSVGLGYLLGMFGVVAFGAVIPVVPTGAAVSVAAALADQHNPLILVLVIAFGAAGAYLGDVITYGALRLAGEPLARRVGWLHEGPAATTLTRLRHQVEDHELRSLLLSRLVPGGRVPLLLAAALGGYSRWSTVYAGIGLAGRAIFPEPWQGAVAAIGLVGVMAAASAYWQARHRRVSTTVGPTSPPA